MRYKSTLLTSILCCSLAQGAMANTNSNVSAEHSATLNWDVAVKLSPINETHNNDVINLVPKQTIMMKAFVWYPTEQIWVVNYPDWDMPGASIEKYTTYQANIERNSQGFAQYGHTQNYLLTPVDIGSLALSQKGIDLSVAQDGSAYLPFAKPLQINVELPEGVYEIDKFLPAYSVKLQQEFFHYTSSASEAPISIDELSKLTLKQGEMLERRITLVADGTRGSSIPDIVPVKNNKSIQVESFAEDIKGIFGFEGGKRQESIFYSPSADGNIVIKPIELTWWHLKNKHMVSQNLDGVSFKSEAVTSYEKAISLTWWEKHGEQATLSISLLVMALGFIGAILFALKVSLVRLQQSVKQGLTKLINREQTIFTKLVLAIVFLPKQRVNKYLVAWLYASKKGTPDALESYLYQSYQSNSTVTPTSRISAVSSLLHLRLTMCKGTTKSSKCRLPEL